MPMQYRTGARRPTMEKRPNNGNIAPIEMACAGRIS
jgi:hypothetical protein